MNKIILADSQAIFSGGTAKVLAMDEDVRIIAQCTDLDRNASRHHHVSRLDRTVCRLAAPGYDPVAYAAGDHQQPGIVIAENNETAGAYLQQGFRGVVFRNVTGAALAECVRAVAAGDTWQPPQLMVADSPKKIWWAPGSANRLTPKEMRIVALIVQGCKNREIAIRLKTTEQVIKNYLRSVYDKTGVSDRLELALFYHSPPRTGRRRRRRWQQARSRAGCQAARHGVKPHAN